MRITTLADERLARAGYEDGLRHAAAGIYDPRHSSLVYLNEYARAQAEYTSGTAG